MSSRTILESRICGYTSIHQYKYIRSSWLQASTIKLYHSHYVSCLVQSKPWQTDTQTINTSSRRIPRITNFIFMFYSHVFLRIFTPCFLNSWAWIPCIWHRFNTRHGRVSNTEHIWEVIIICTWLRRSEVLSWSSLKFSPRSNVWKYNKLKESRSRNALWIPQTSRNGKISPFCSCFT
jgi:hypothetical protein